MTLTSVMEQEELLQVSRTSAQSTVAKECRLFDEALKDHPMDSNPSAQFLLDIGERHIIVIMHERRT